MLESNIKPNVIENLGNGYWYYNYNIQETEGENGSSYTFTQIRVAGKPEYKKCVELILRQYMSESQEFDLINSANKDLMSGITDSANIDKYKTYLDEVEHIKNIVAQNSRKSRFILLFFLSSPLLCAI